MKNRLKLMMPDGTDGNGNTQQVDTQNNQQQVSDYKWEFKDPEIKENFGKMFPGMKSVEDLAKTAIHQQRKIGQQGVQLPTKPEEFPAWAQTHLKAPKDGKGYDFKDLKIPEGLNINREALTSFAENFAKAGMTQAQTNMVLESFYGVASQEQQQSTAKRNELATASKATLEKKWGTDYKTKMAGAEMALSTLGGPDLVKLATESGLVNHSEFVEFLANASELMKEDPATGKLSSGGFAAGPEQAQQEIDLLYANADFMKQYSNQNDHGYANARSRMERLYKIKHGELGRGKQ